MPEIEVFSAKVWNPNSRVPGPPGWGLERWADYSTSEKKSIVEKPLSERASFDRSAWNRKMEEVKAQFGL